MRRAALPLFLCLAASSALAQNVVDRHGFAAAVGWDFETAEIRVEKLGEQLSVLFGLGGNIVASVGPQGVLIVDDQFPELIEKLDDTIAELGGDGIDFAVNTHWHFDHADGNLVLGPRGVWLVSHLNSRRMLLDDHRIDLVRLQYDQEAYPADALPVITYEDRMQFHFNGERIDLLHFGPAHTNGDTAVYFRDADVVHMGDVFGSGGYPFIDAGNGGSLEGVINFCRGVLDEIAESTVVVPGHGPVATYDDLVSYVEMLETIRDRIVALIDRGASLLEVIEAKPTAEWDERRGDPLLLLDRSYHGLVRRGRSE